MHKGMCFEFNAVKMCLACAKQLDNALFSSNRAYLFSPLMKYEACTQTGSTCKFVTLM